MEKSKKKFNIFKLIANIISWTVLTILIGVIVFLVFVVVTTKVSEKMGRRPFFSLYTIVSPSMVPNLNVYDVVFVAEVDTKKLKVGDVISFYVPGNTMLSTTPVTHRINQTATTPEGETVYQTKGDNNDAPDLWAISGEDIIGQVLFKIPQLGKLQFFLASKTGWFIIILIPALGIIAYDLFKILKLVLLKNRIAAERKDGGNKTNTTVQNTTVINNTVQVPTNNEIKPAEKVVNNVPIEKAVKSTETIVNNPQQAPINNNPNVVQNVVSNIPSEPVQTPNVDSLINQVNLNNEQKEENIINLDNNNTNL